MNLYKLQRSVGNGEAFEDASEWMPAEACIVAIRELSPLQGEMQVVDERGRVVVSTMGPRFSEPAVPLSRRHE